MKKLIEKLNLEYVDKLENYALQNGGIDGAVFSFSERFKVVNAFEPSFNTNEIKSETLRSALKQSLLLSEYWFTFETLKYELNELGRGQDTIYTLVKVKEFQESQLNVIYKAFYELYRTEIGKKNLLRLIEHLSLDPKLGREQEKLLRGIYEKIKTNEWLILDDFIPIIYAMRNSYVHSGKIHFKDIGVGYIKDVTEILVNILKIILYIIAVTHLF